MALFNKMKSPVFLKEDSDARLYVRNLKEMREDARGELASKLDKEINIASAGLIGEDQVAFELKHCDMPIYVLRDLHIKFEDVSAQIDFAVVTKKFTLFIECKNMIGNIEIDSQGNFIRSYKYGSKWVKEGIYSPITQNQRHLDVMKRIFVSRQPNKIMAFAAEKIFKGMYRSVVVMANPKTILNDKYAPKDIKEKVIRADQIGTYIKDLYKASKEPVSNEKQHLEFAENLLKKHKPNETDYMKKFQDLLEEQQKCQSEMADFRSQPTAQAQVQSRQNTMPEVKPSQMPTDNKHVIRLIQELKQYRLEQSRNENKKPYMIFNNKQMDHLVKVSPRNHQELLTVNGFGPVKTERYGEDILRIISKYQ